MGTRAYDKLLDCGCALSADKGGGLMPCYAEFGNMSKKKDREAFELHEKSWEEWEKSTESKEHEKEIQRRNN